MPVSPKIAAKRDRILRGLRELCEEQKRTGRAYTAAEIAAASDCSGPAIEQIEWKARETLAKRLRPYAQEAGIYLPKELKKEAR